MSPPTPSLIPTTRREFLARSGAGLGAVAVAALLAEAESHAAAPASSPAVELVMTTLPRFCFIMWGPTARAK